MVLALLCSAVLTAAPADQAPVTPPVESSAGPLVPWLVPRSASLGVFFNAPMVAPHFRIAWHGAILSQPRNELLWVFTLGSGFGLGVPSPMLTHSQHVLLAGFGYRSDRPLLHWGFHVAAGPVWYLATYAPGAINRDESRVLGYIEGKAQLGIHLSPHFRLAVYFGYASPFAFNVRFPGNTYIGGIDTGLVIDWR